MTPDYIRSRINYNPETGEFTWASNRCKNLVGRWLGHLNRGGYFAARINEQNFRLHRLAWLCFYGEWPAGHIDHIDGDRTNNRIANLRLATISQNAGNRRVLQHEHLKGAFRCRKKWFSQIKHGGCYRFLGMFATEQDAHAAYCRAARELFGEFARVA